MEEKNIEKIKDIVFNQYEFSSDEKLIIEKMLQYELNYDRIYVILKAIKDYNLDKNSVLAFFELSII